MGVREARRCPAHRCRRALDADQRPTEYCLRVARDVLDDLLGRILRQIGMLSQLRSCERYDEPETLPSSICLICPTVLTVDSSPCRTEFPPPWSVEETDACFIVVAVKTRHKLRSTNAKPAQCPPSQGRPISFRLPLRNTLRGPGGICGVQNKKAPSPSDDNYDAHDCNHISEDSSPHGCPHFDRH